MSGSLGQRKMRKKTDKPVVTLPRRIDDFKGIEDAGEYLSDRTGLYIQLIEHLIDDSDDPTFKFAGARYLLAIAPIAQRWRPATARTIDAEPSISLQLTGNDAPQLENLSEEELEKMARGEPLVKDKGRLS